MGRPKGSKNRRTILREAEQYVGAKYVDQVLDSLYVLESAMRHFYVRAEMRIQKPPHDPQRGGAVRRREIRRSGVGQPVRA